jgi:hypothetical protein
VFRSFSFGAGERSSLICDNIARRELTTLEDSGRDFIWHMADLTPPPALCPDDLIVISPTVVSTRTGDDTLIHDMITQELFRLNDVGTRVWELIDPGSTVEAVIRAIATEYNVPRDASMSQVREDVTALLTELSRRQLVRARA